MPRLHPKPISPVKPGKNLPSERANGAATGHTSFRSEIDKTLADLDKKSTQRRKRKAA